MSAGRVAAEHPGEAEAVLAPPSRRSTRAEIEAHFLRLSTLVGALEMTGQKLPPAAGPGAPEALAQGQADFSDSLVVCGHARLREAEALELLEGLKVDYAMDAEGVIDTLRRLGPSGRTRLASRQALGRLRRAAVGDREWRVHPQRWIANLTHVGLNQQALPSNLTPADEQAERDYAAAFWNAVWGLIKTHAPWGTSLETAAPEECAEAALRRRGAWTLVHEAHWDGWIESLARAAHPGPDGQALPCPGGEAPLNPDVLAHLMKRVRLTHLEAREAGMQSLYYTSKNTEGALVLDPEVARELNLAHARGPWVLQAWNAAHVQAIPATQMTVDQLSRLEVPRDAAGRRRLRPVLQELLRNSRVLHALLAARSPWVRSARLDALISPFLELPLADHLLQCRDDLSLPGPELPWSAGMAGQDESTLAAARRSAARLALFSRPAGLHAGKDLAAFCGWPLMDDNPMHRRLVGEPRTRTFRDDADLLAGLRERLSLTETLIDGAEQRFADHQPVGAGFASDLRKVLDRQGQSAAALSLRHQSWDMEAAQGPGPTKIADRYDRLSSRLWLLERAIKDRPILP